MASSSNGVSLLQRLIDLARPSSNFNDRTDKRQITKLNEASKLFFEEKRQNQILDASPHRVAVQSHTSDGTPLLLAKTFVKQLRERVVKRRGKAAAIFLR